MSDAALTHKPNSNSAPGRTHASGWLRRALESDIFYSFRRSRLTMVAAAVTLLFFLLAIAAPLLAVQNPFDPAQLQLQGPLPPTAEADPVVQSPLVGAVLTATPFAGPHTPFTGWEATFVAEQVAVVPPLLPAQFQLQGPPPVTVDAVPALQRLAVGALDRLDPFEAPHAPLTLPPPAAAVSVA